MSIQAPPTNQTIRPKIVAVLFPPNTIDGAVLHHLKSSFESPRIEVFDFLSLAVGALGLQNRQATTAELVQAIKNGSRELVSNLRAQGVHLVLASSPSHKTGVVVGEWEDGSDQVAVWETGQFTHVIWVGYPADIGDMDARVHWERVLITVREKCAQRHIGLRIVNVQGNDDALRDTGMFHEMIAAGGL